MFKTILMIDDKPNVRDIVRDFLTEENFNVIVAENGQQAMNAAIKEQPDLILLDNNIPHKDGVAFLRDYRSEHNIPIILLTPQIEESEKVLGKDLGVDDYLTKPFGMRELVARIRAVERRTGKNGSSARNLQIGSIQIDQAHREVRVNGNPVNLTPSEYELLALLMSSPGQAFSRTAIMEKLHGKSFDGATRTIDVHIRNLRTKIEADPNNPQYIETAFGIGYRFRRD